MESRNRPPEGLCLNLSLPTLRTNRIDCKLTSHLELVSSWGSHWPSGLLTAIFLIGIITYFPPHHRALRTTGDKPCFTPPRYCLKPRLSLPCRDGQN
ncbi:hypothetical protein BJX63DRAFT_35397 [Aspergillus granulosus]|uniref:Uncharacterized protein n=1 Tax=Aspergillus granulosus TaxID=176169 RepID=A0ABR4GYV9_9EURO